MTVSDLSTTHGPDARERVAWLGLLTLAITILNAFAMRGVFSPVQDIVKADLGLTDVQLGLVQGLAASIPIALLAVPLGRITDRGNRMRLLLALGVTWTIGTIATAFVTNFYGLFLARMLASVGAICAVPVAISIAADLSPPGYRGRALLLLSLGNIAGAACAFAFGGPILGALENTLAIANLAPWRGVHVVFAITSLVLLLPLLLMREPVRREVSSDAGLAFGAALQAIWRRRALLAPLFMGQISAVMADTAAGIWAAPVLSRDYELQPEQFASWMGLVILCSGLLGSILGGVLADGGHKSGIKGGILIGAVVASVLAIPGALFPVMPDVVSFAWVLGLLLTCCTITGLVTAAAVAVLIPNEIRGVCLSLFMVVGAIIGLGLAPTLVTLFSDALGGESALRYGLAATCAITGVGAAIGFIAALAQARRDAFVPA
ncbi:MAG: MFS transporter [Hyphomonadaceae bacterium]